jgi:hypothetical protein
MSDIIWEQMGQTIPGAQADDNLGRCVALSGNGYIMAVGSINNDAIGSNSGEVRVYEYNEPEDLWEQIGDDINGEASGDKSGWSISLSDNGTILAIGAIYNDGSASNGGHVRVYEYSGGNWVQKGTDIDGTTTDGNSGFSVSLSDDGLSLVVGNPKELSGKGCVKYYMFENNDWVFKKSKIGPQAGDQFGFSVDLSNDGSRVVVGGPYHDIGGGDSSGLVRVQHFDSEISGFPLVGTAIKGSNVGDNMGISVATSGDGSIIVFGVTGYDSSNMTNNGIVQVYQYSNSLGDWEQLGNDIEGESSNDKFGYSVAISDNGTIIAVGAYLNDGDGGVNSGHVRVYEFLNGNWGQVGDDIDGNFAGDRFGRSVALSNNGSILAVGASFNDDNGNKSGHVRTFILPIKTEESIQNALQDTPSQLETGKYIVSNADITSTLGDIYHNLNEPGKRTQRKKVARGILKKYKNLLLSGETVFTDASSLSLTDSTLTGFSRFKLLNASSSLNGSDSVPLTTTANISELGDGEGFYTLLDETGDNIKLIGESSQFIEITKRADGDYDVNKNDVETVIMSEGDSLDLYGVYFVLGSVTGGEGTQSSSSNICFVASTPVQTDQGKEQISKLIPGYHTIDGKQIKAITETVTKDKYIYKIKRNAFGKNKPSRETIVSGNHLIEFDYVLVPVRSLEEHPNVESLKYNGERLYNILMDKHEIITINNMKVETLHPNNLIAKLFTNESFKKMDKKEKNIFIKKFNKKVDEMNLIKYH